MKTINTKWKAAIGIILTMILTLMLLTIIYWLFIEQQIETRTHLLVMMGMIYGGMYLHHVLIKRYTCWWKVLTEEEEEN